MRQKGFTPIVLILIVIIVLLVGVVLWQGINSRPTNNDSSILPVASLQPSPSTTANPNQSWETYQNSIYNYEISFPSEFTLAESSYGGGPASDKSSGITIGKQGEEATVIIQYVGMNKSPMATLETTLAGLKAYKVENENIPTDVYYLNIPDTDQFLEIYAHKEVNQNVIDEILSTFKFTQ